MPTNADMEKRARNRVAELKGFYTHLISYVVINAFLVVINLITSPGTLWFYWITIFWGLGVVFHAISVYGFSGRLLGKEWEERKTRELMEKEESEHKRQHHGAA